MDYMGLVLLFSYLGLAVTIIRVRLKRKNKEIQQLFLIRKNLSDIFFRWLYQNQHLYTDNRSLLLSEPNLRLVIEADLKAYSQLRSLGVELFSKTLEDTLRELILSLPSISTRNSDKYLREFRDLRARFNNFSIH